MASFAGDTRVTSGRKKRALLGDVRQTGKTAGGVLTLRPPSSAKDRLARESWDTPRLNRAVQVGVPLLFLVTLAFPPEVAVHLGPIKLPLYRVVLLLVFFPTLIGVIRREGLSLPDYLVLASASWSVLALALHHGMSAWEFAGITALELIGPYFLARRYIASPQAMKKVVRGYFLVVAALVPVAVYETATGHFIVRDLAQSVLGGGGSFGRPGRMGLDRAYVSFEHPIHYGVFVAGLTGMAMALAGSLLWRMFRYAVLLIGTFCSLSTGPLIVFVVQTQLLIWDILTRGIRYRWHALAGLVVLAYVTVDIISNRTPFHVIASYLSFRLVSAYNRIHIWNYGVQNVAENPVFGIGQGDWERPSWMSSSMDNYWLVIALRYGLPAFLFLAAAIFIVMRRAARADHDGEAAEMRKGWLISMTGLIIAGGTVHYWSAMGCLFVLIVGMGFCFGQPGPRADRRTTSSAPGS